jgi:hypothetical protein
MKPWYRSKTIVVNAVAAGLVALEAVSGLLQPHLPVNFYTAVAIALPVINAMLRVITSEGLKA